MRRRSQRRRDGVVRSIGLWGGFDSIADGFATLGEGMGSLMGVDVEDPGDGNGRWVYKKKPPHDCVLPDYKDASEGDTWQCGVCSSIWVVVGGKDGVVMERTEAGYHQGHTTGTGGYGYTYTMTPPYWWSSETRIEGGSENP